MVVRKILEETGLTVEVLAPLTVQRESPRHFTFVLGPRAGGTSPPSAEVSEVRFTAPGAWPDRASGRLHVTSRPDLATGSATPLSVTQCCSTGKVITSLL